MATLLGFGPALARAETCTFTKETDVPAVMRDGTTLRADVYTPDGAGPWPVILMRLPYNKSVAQTYVYAPPDFYASHCYLVVIQDVRGQYASDGSFYAFRDEMKDGYDTVEWAAGLPRSSGKVGMYGFSYVGATQWWAATQQPPHLAAIVPAMTGDDYYEGWSYQDGAWSLAFEESWPITTITRSAMVQQGRTGVLPILDAAAASLPTWYQFLPLLDFPPLVPNDPTVAPYFYDWLRHPTWDDYWRQWSIRLRWNQVAVPALNFDGWYDVFNNGAINNFVGMRMFGGTETARRGQQLVIGPWIHLPWTRQVGELDFGPEADNPIEDLQLRWFDHWLKGADNGVDREAPVRLFVMGANKWREASDWPVPGTIWRDYYLRSAKGANGVAGDGVLSAERPGVGRFHPKLFGSKAVESPVDRYTYDPADPVPSRGGHSCCTPDVAPVGPYDQGDVEKRPDVLVYTTEALERPVEVTGPITVTLYASSSAPDTDFTAKLVDVYPEGRAINLNDGVIRARYRNSTVETSLIEPGKVYRYTIHVWPTSNLFKAGHRIRLEISSSNFPMYDRNPNTGHPFGQDALLRPAHQTILHDPAHPSRVTLPVMPHPIE
ncbi:MAG TPA: CocE/NonD family hydrolase [Anaeromyxobacteraceae bacterium]|nr:CocE/NonD family hydrolase [Anaeromyxobacteraceae bacterium]